MNTKRYFKMITNYLNEETTYKMVESNCHAKDVKGIAKILEKYNINLTKKGISLKRISHVTQQLISVGSLKFPNLN